MQCQKTQEQLSAYLDGMLNPADREQAELHLNQCPVCRLELDELKMVIGLVQNLPPVDSPAGFRKDIMHKIARIERSDRKQGLLSILAKGRFSGWMAVAASFLLVVGVAAHWYGLPWKNEFPGSNSQVVSDSAHQNGSIEQLGSTKVATKGISSGNGPKSQESASNVQSNSKGLLGNELMDASSTQPLQDHTQTESGFSPDRREVPVNGLPERTARGNSPFSMLAAPEQQPKTSIEIKVQDKAKAVQEVSGIAERQGGSATLLGGAESLELMVSIPETALEQVLKDISQIGVGITQEGIPKEGLVDAEEPVHITSVGSEVYDSNTPEAKENNPAENQQKDSSPALTTIKVRLQ